jgi:hypothetical protein
MYLLVQPPRRLFGQDSQLSRPIWNAAHHRNGYTPHDVAEVGHLAAKRDVLEKLASGLMRIPVVENAQAEKLT